MYWCKGFRVIYVSLIVLEVNLNTRAMESRASLLSENGDELRSLEICTARNQQRLGSVYGNFTRHHKKGHRRRTTTTSAPTTMILRSTTTSADVDKTTNYASTTEYVLYQTTHVNLPKPLRLSARVLDSDYSYDVHNVDTLIDEEIDELTLKERHHLKRKRNSDNELLRELSDASLKTNLNKVMKLYRDSSASVVNKVGNKNSKSGIFLTDNCTTVIAQIGTTAILHCEVSDITENTVTWIRKKDYSLLSVGLVTYSADRRFSSAHGRHVKDWALHIRFATSADAGYYECQVPTHPPTSIFFKLVLVAAYAEIMGESEKIIHEGSMLRLVCIVRRSTEPPSYVFWYFENRMINYDLNGVSVHNGRQTSELVIGKAEPRHAGNYTCVPANAKATSVTVHVVQSETPAAMQHGNNSACSKIHVHFLITLLLISIMSIRISHFQNYQDFG